jgi:hypothetical protein
MKLRDPQKLLDSKEFFQVIQRNFADAVEIGETYETRIAALLAAWGEKADNQAPLLELAVWTGTFIKEVMKDHGGDIKDPEVCTEWRINMQVAIVLAGAIHVMACLGTRRGLQAVDAIMKLEKKLEQSLSKEKFHA